MKMNTTGRDIGAPQFSGKMVDVDPPVSDETLDFAAAMARLDDDRELYNEMARFFLEDAPPLLDTIRSATLAQDYEAAARSAHSLRNLAATCGGNIAAQTAQRVEHLATAKNQLALAEANCELVASVQTLRQRLLGLLAAS